MKTHIQEHKTGWYLGLDMAKANFHWCLVDVGGARAGSGRLANDTKGAAALVAAMHQICGDPGRVHAVMEATGRCGWQLLEFLHKAGMKVSSVNPAQIKYFAASLNKRTKNDPADADTIARYARERRPLPSRPPSKAECELKELCSHLDSLVNARTALKNRLGEVEASGGCRQVVASLRRQIKSADAEVAAAGKAIDKLASKNPEMAESIDLLTTIPGIARRSAASIIAQMSAHDFESARQLAAYAGVTPRENKSGSSLAGKTRMCKQGNAVLRKCLYMPAMTLMTRCLPIRQWAEHIARRTGSRKAALGAVMRKLAHIIFGVLKHRTAFDVMRVQTPVADA